MASGGALLVYLLAGVSLWLALAVLVALGTARRTDRVGPPHRAWVPARPRAAARRFVAGPLAVACDDLSRLALVTVVEEST